MKWPRKGILIRIVIYGTLIGYFGWRAAEHYLRSQAAERSEIDLRKELEHNKSTVTLPDGSEQEVYEITPEQAERLFGVKAKAPAETGQ